MNMCEDIFFKLIVFVGLNDSFMRRTSCVGSFQNKTTGDGRNV